MVLTRAALERMRSQGRGALLTVSSLTALQPTPYQATYGASKAFVTSFFEALHEETRDGPVTATTVLPGFVRTDFAHHARAHGAYDRVPPGLWLTPDRVAPFQSAWGTRSAGMTPNRPAL